MKKYLVIGNPIDHSLSPKLQNYWIKLNKIDDFETSKSSEKSLFPITPSNDATIDLFLSSMIISPFLYF